MKTKQIIIYIFIIISVLNLKAEDDKLQAANWIFGNSCWLDFSSGVPVSKDNAKMETHEGVATISDKDGNLLFYTDGSIVRNKNHQIMENGEDLYGSYSASQSGVIIPAPDNSNLYYVFTVDELYNHYNDNHIRPNHHGFNYSMVDISKNNGLGKVIQKNINLFAFTCEKITAIGHTTKDAYWVIAQEWGTNIIYVYLIDRKGLHFDHKYTSHIFSNYYNPATTKGYLKFSADGTRLASANNGIGLALYDFNAKTGKISNEILIKNSYFKNSYGIEFSPSGKYLYLSSMPFAGISSKNVNAYIVQIDISLSNAPDIANSSVILLEESNKNKWWMGALQIAIDGKIYLSIFYNSSFYNRNYLSAIEFPEKKGKACNFILKAINLDYGVVMIGLPSMIQSFFVSMTVDITHELCEGDVIVLDAEYIEGTTYHWEGPNGFSADTCYAEIHNATRGMSGIYTLNVLHENRTELETFEYEIEVQFVDLDITFNNTKPIIDTNDIVNKIVRIKNKSEYDIEIQNIFLKNNGRDYEIENITLPMFIQTNQTSDDIKIRINTAEKKSIEDLFTVVVNVPCSQKYIYQLKDKVGKDNIIFYLSDTTVSLGRFFRYYIYANSEIDLSSLKFDVFIRLKYFVDFYNIYKSPNFPFEKSYNGDTIFTSFTLKDVQFSTIKKRIRTLTGTTLLGNLTYTPVMFDSVGLSNDFYQATIKNGSILSDEEICNRDLLGIRYFNNHIVYSIENPNTTGNLILSSPDKGNLNLQLFSYTGKLVYENNFYSENNDFKRTINIPDLEPGVYVILWISAKNSYRKKIQFE